MNLRRLQSIRLTWPQLAMVVAASALATGVIIHVLGSAPGLPYATLAALRQRVAVHTVPSAASAVPGASPSSAGASGAPADVPASSAPISSADTGSTNAGSTDTGAQDTSSTGAGSTGTGSSGADGSSTATTHRAGHVFVIALTAPNFRAAFGQGSVARYLNGTLRHRGVLLSGYRTLGASDLPDYLAMVSGQAPNPDTRSDCTTYAEFATQAAPLASGQVPGAGCVYPNTVLTIGDQVTADGKQWRAYLAGMGASTCVHPNSGAAADDPLAGAGPQYDVVHNPFIYFHSLLDLGGCASDDMSLQHLAHDLRGAKRTPTYAFIAPGLCADPGAPACPGSQPSGLAAEDAFLKRWVPAITASPAYKQDGVLMIVFARAPMAGSGPVRTGALILSPRARAGSTVATPFTPYSVLRSAEDLLGYTPLVHAKAARSFAAAAAPGA